MNIVGLDAVVFGVDDMAACAQYLKDYGLIAVNESPAGGRYEALDGTAVVLADAADESLPAGLANGCQLRKTVMGVADEVALQEIVEELRKDREVRQLADGSYEAEDDCGFVLGFQVTVRRPFEKPSEFSNAPGSSLQREMNSLGVDKDAEQIRPGSLSHIVYFVPDVAKAEAFYVERLGYRCTDRFEGVGPFLQPAGMQDHHTHFLLPAPPHMQGVEHFTFHFSGPTEVIQNGTRFVDKGYQAFWGPGRHIFGSNWFWYFNSPFGCHMEMDADMDLHDAEWEPRVAHMSADASQTFLMKHRNKWSPGPGAPEDGDYA